MHSEPIKARVIRMAMIRLDPQLDDPEPSADLSVLHLKVLITGHVVRIRVLVSTKLHRLVVILVVQALKDRRNPKSINLSSHQLIDFTPLTQTENPLGADSILPLDNVLGMCSIVNPST